MEFGKEPTVSIWSDLLEVSVSRVANTRVIQAGSGRPMLLLHGAGGHAENFRHNIAAYAAHCHVIAPDLRWHGLADTDGSPDDLIPELAEHARRILDALEISTCIIEGQSMGGWVATRLALDSPDRITALVLTTPMGLLDTVFTDPVDLDTIVSAQLAALEHADPESIRRRMAGLFADPALLDAEIVDVRARIYGREGTRRALREVALRYFDPHQIDRHRIGIEELSTLSMPCLVYWGSHNDFPEQSGEAIARALGAEFHCAETGHWAQYERADEHNLVVTRFLANVVAGRAGHARP